jgi:hypothetical protein
MTDRAYVGGSVSKLLGIKHSSDYYLPQPVNGKRPAKLVTTHLFLA